MVYSFVKYNLEYIASYDKCFFILQLMVYGVTGEVMVLVQQRAAMVPVLGQGRATILHLLLMGRLVRECIQAYAYVTINHVQVRICKF